MPPANTVNPQSPCPCGTAKALADCCLPYIRRQKPAPTAEALMRSRYSAHVLAEVDYLWETWDDNQRRNSSRQEILDWASSCQWLGLSILSTQAGREGDSEGIVAFIASYSQRGKIQQHHEISLFRKQGEQWLYISHC